MAKRKETIELEKALIKDTREKRIYGCEEITIGFYNNGHGNEIVDFMTMDSKGIIKCYEYIPNYIGIIVGTYLEVVKKPKKQTLNSDTETMLKESLVRSMYWKIDKYKNANNLDRQKELMSKIRKVEKERDNYYKRALRAESIISEYENYKSYNDGIDINLELLAKEERNKYRSRNGRELFA